MSYEQDAAHSHLCLPSSKFHLHIGAEYCPLGRRVSWTVHDTTVHQRVLLSETIIVPEVPFHCPHGQYLWLQGLLPTMELLLGPLETPPWTEKKAEKMTKVFQELQKT